MGQFVRLTSECELKKGTLGLAILAYASLMAVDVGEFSEVFWRARFVYERHSQGYLVTSELYGC